MTAEEINKTRVVVIDDNAMNLELLSHLLQISGYEVSTAQDGDEAMQKISHCEPSLIVSDIRMPKVDGFELIKRLKADEHTREIPLLAISGSGIGSSRKICLKAGFDQYLQKPIEPEEFLSTVASMTNADDVSES